MDATNKSESLNTMPDGTCRTIKSQYFKNSIQNFENQSSYGATGIIVAMRDRNPNNPSDRTEGSRTEQGVEPNSQSICNTLTSVQKDNMVLKKEGRFFTQAIETLTENDCKYGDVINAYNKSIDKSGICPTITTRPEGFKTAILPVITSYKIRKLTPIECWRLMGFSDEDFHKAKKVNSNSQLYKQAGNSIVKNVLMAIFEKML